MYPIPKNIACQNTRTCVKWDQKINKNVSNKLSKVNILYFKRLIRARITLKLGGLLSFMLWNAFQHVWEKSPDRGRASSTISWYSFNLKIIYFTPTPSGEHWWQMVPDCRDCIIVTPWHQNKIPKQTTHSQNPFKWWENKLLFMSINQMRI